MNDEYVIRPIGIIRSCYTEKFGIPRQPGLVKAASARLIMRAPCNRLEMFKGLERFSHIWLQFLFHATVAEGWKPTVRPPRLGGRERVGVFASRSPHRPNHIGLSAVRLVKVGREGKQVVLDLAEIDLLDGTPVIDIKPYIPYSDRLEDADDGYAAPLAGTAAEVRFQAEALEFCRGYERKTGRGLQALIRETLCLDPRPASHRPSMGEYGMLVWDINVRWRVESGGFLVLGCEETGRDAGEVRAARIPG